MKSCFRSRRSRGTDLLQPVICHQLCARQCLQLEVLLMLTGIGLCFKAIILLALVDENGVTLKPIEELKTKLSKYQSTSLVKTHCTPQTSGNAISFRIIEQFRAVSWQYLFYERLQDNVLFDCAKFVVSPSSAFSLRPQNSTRCISLALYYNNQSPTFCCCVMYVAIELI